MRFASSIRSCLRGPELGLGLRHIAHNIVKHTIVIEYRPAIGRRYSLFVHKMGGGLYWSSKIFLILSSIIILQFAVVLAVSNVIWVRTSSCCEFKLVVMHTVSSEKFRSLSKYEVATFYSSMKIREIAMA